MRVLFLFLKAYQPGLFDEQVTVSGHATKKGTYVQPYQAKRKKRHDEPQAGDLFADVAVPKPEDKKEPEKKEPEKKPISRFDLPEKIPHIDPKAIPQWPPDTARELRIEREIALIEKSGNKADAARKRGFYDQMLGFPSKRAQYNDRLQVAYDQGVKKAKAEREIIDERFGGIWYSDNIKKDGALWSWVVYREGYIIASGKEKSETRAQHSALNAKLDDNEKQASRKPNQDPRDEKVQAEAETAIDDDLAKLFFDDKNKDQKVDSGPNNPIAASLENFAIEQDKIADDWRARAYKKNAATVEFEGDGRSSNPSARIDSINEGRRQKAIENAGSAAAAIRKLASNGDIGIIEEHERAKAEAAKWTRFDMDRFGVESRDEATEMVLNHRLTGRYSKGKGTPGNAILVAVQKAETQVSPANKQKKSTASQQETADKKPDIAPRKAVKAKSATITEPADDLIREHARLVKVLRSPSHADDLEEADEQEKELKEYRKKRKRMKKALLVAPLTALLKARAHG